MEIPQMTSGENLRLKRWMRPNADKNLALGIIGLAGLLLVPGLLILLFGPVQVTQAQGQSTPTAEATQGASKNCLDGTLALSILQTPAPVTPTAAPSAVVSPTIAAAAPVSPTVAAAPLPTPTLRPAPATDNVGFPKDWETFTHVGSFDRGPAGLVRVICFNDAAMQAKPGGPFPYGSVIALLTWRAKAEAPGKFALDENGHLIRESLLRVEAMRKEKGFGAAYKEFASGEWEYGSYNPDGSTAIPSQATGSCAACHLAGSNEDLDWTFFASRAHQGLHYRSVLSAAQSPIQLSHIVSMGFGPNNITVKPGTVVVFDNQDFIGHTVTARDGSFDSDAIPPGGTFSRIFDKPGTYAFYCQFHPAQMAGTIKVQ